MLAKKDFVLNFSLADNQMAITLAEVISIRGVRRTRLTELCQIISIL